MKIMQERYSHTGTLIPYLPSYSDNHQIIQIIQIIHNVVEHETQ